MKPAFAGALLSLVLAATGCSDPFAMKKAPSRSQACVEKSKSTSLQNWVGRVAPMRRSAELSLTYGVDLPFDDAKRLENALSQLPGDSQDVTFDGQGSVHVEITDEGPPVEYAVSANSDGKSEMASRLLIAETLCGAVSAVNGTLTHISVRTAGYSLDDGKVHVPPVP